MARNSGAGAGAVLADHGRLARHQIALVDVEAVGMREPGPAPGDVPGGGHRPVRAGLGQVAAQRVPGEAQRLRRRRRRRRPTEQIVCGRRAESGISNCHGFSGLGEVAAAIVAISV